MTAYSFGSRSYGRPKETKWRYRFSILTVLSTVALIAWGGFVTSIGAGMAVPDWPASFGSFDPFRTGFHDPTDPAAQWWHSVPILAEHGHRLLGMLVGLFTMRLAGGTWMKDPRRWMRWLGVAALVLVIAQGILGGLRVVYISMDLAVVHACVAQIFFAMIVAMTLFTSRWWMQPRVPPVEAGKLRKLRILAGITIGVLYIQIILGALLRHPGASIDQTLAILHITGAFVCTIAIAALVVYIRRHFAAEKLLKTASSIIVGVLIIQLTLGFTAYFVILDEAGVLQPSNFQVIVNSAHLVVGSFLFATAASIGIISMRSHREPALADQQASRPQKATIR